MNKKAAMEIIKKAREKGQKALSEFEAKQVLAAYDIPVTREMIVEDQLKLEQAAAQIGFPLVMKACSADVAHKTENNLVRVDLRTSQEAGLAFAEISEQMPDGENSGVLVQEMVSGKRELVMGMTRDPQFGACVMFGLGGIFTEILKDIVFRKAPLAREDALDMMQEIRGRKILEAVRGMPAADTDLLAQMLIAVAQIGLDMEHVAEIDINPVILAGSRPVAVDALIVLA